MCVCVCVCVCEETNKTTSIYVGTRMRRGLVALETKLT